MFKEKLSTIRVIYKYTESRTKNILKGFLKATLVEKAYFDGKRLHTFEIVLNVFLLFLRPFAPDINIATSGFLNILEANIGIKHAKSKGKTTPIVTLAIEMPRLILSIP